MKLLDCTLRDGGYYTNWDFPDPFIEAYYSAMSELPIDVVEVGYRSPCLAGYYGKYFHCHRTVLEQARERLPGKQLAIMVNEKSVCTHTLEEILKPVADLVDVVRFAVDPDRIDSLQPMVELVSSLDAAAAINLMYASQYRDRIEDLISAAKACHGASVLSLVDSYGGIYPEDIRAMVGAVSSATDMTLGYHGHNNLELAFANALAALESGCEWIDVTVSGMGRGAGNLKTELFLAYLQSAHATPIDLDCLSNVLEAIQPLYEEHRWGTNLPYMVSGVSSLPQKDVMDWVTKRYLSINAITRAVEKQREGKDDDRVFSAPPKENYSEALLIGGGPSVTNAGDSIVDWLGDRPNMPVIYSSSRHLSVFNRIALPQFFCLIGNEADRLSKLANARLPDDYHCVLSPSPRKMGTVVIDELSKRTYELGSMKLAPGFDESSTAIALETAAFLGVKTLWVAGYDGYNAKSLGIRERELFQENEAVFANATANGIQVRSLTQTLYRGLQRDSVFAQLANSL